LAESIVLKKKIEELDNFKLEMSSDTESMYFKLFSYRQNIYVKGRQSNDMESESNLKMLTPKKSTKKTQIIIKPPYQTHHPKSRIPSSMDLEIVKSPKSKMIRAGQRSQSVPFL